MAESSTPHCGAEHAKGKVPAHYACLGVAPSISQHELARQYKRLSLQLHPDRAAYRDSPGEEDSARQRYQTITAAYHVLSDPQRRAAYDTQHGVNFPSRVAHMQQKIRGALPAEDSEAVAVGSEAKRSRCEGSADGAEEEDDDDDDEAYVPESSPSPPASTSEPTDARRLFSLYPRQQQGRQQHTGAAGSRDSMRLKQVVLYPHRDKRHAEGEDGGALSQYGIVVHRNQLLRASTGDVPFPAIITIVNGTAVNATDNVAALIEHKVVSKAKTARADTQDDNPSHGEEVEGERSDEAGAPLELTLCYSTNEFDLVGNTSLLADARTIDLLLHRPHHSDDDAESTARDERDHAAELPSLHPGASIVSVNGECVESQQLLRERLMALASVQQDRGATRQGGGGRPLAIWVEFASIADVDP